MVESLPDLLRERKGATYYPPRQSTSFESERPSHYRSLSGETLSGGTYSPTALSSRETLITESSDPFFETLTCVEPPEPSGILFQLRHRFLGWLITVLEGCYTEYATAKLGRLYLDDVLSDKCLDDVAQIDLPLWRHTIERAIEKGVLTSQDFFAYKINRSNILNGAEAVRHAWIHREDILMIDLLDAKCLPGLLGDSGREVEIQHAFHLISAATANTDNVDQNIMDSIDHLFATPGAIHTQTDVFAGFQRLIERRLYHYSQQKHPGILEHNGWTTAEQGEMSRWEEAFRDIPFVSQSDFPNDAGSLLSSCLSKARRLRNDVAHRHRYGREGFLDHVHNSIKTLLVLGDHSSAIEVEITAETWLLRTTRLETLLRLRDEYLADDVEGIADSLEKRREMNRRTAIAETLRGEALPDRRYCFSTVDAKPRWDESSRSQLSLSETDCTQEESPKRSIPEQIRLTPPDNWASRRETFSNSMHPMLKVLSAPEWGMLWDYCVAKGELDWERIFEASKYSHDDNIFVLDERVNHQHPESDEERADWSSDTTVLNEEDDGDEVAEWFACDDTAFGHENDSTFRPVSQPETSKEIEPEGVWISSEAINAGAPW